MVTMQEIVQSSRLQKPFLAFKTSAYDLPSIILSAYFLLENNSEDAKC